MKCIKEVLVAFVVSDRGFPITHVAALSAESTLFNPSLAAAKRLDDGFTFSLFLGPKKKKMSELGNLEHKVGIKRMDGSRDGLGFGRSGHFVRECVEPEKETEKNKKDRHLVSGRPPTVFTGVDGQRGGCLGRKITSSQHGTVACLEGLDMQLVQWGCSPTHRDQDAPENAYKRDSTVEWTEEPLVRMPCPPAIPREVAPPICACRTRSLGSISKKMCYRDDSGTQATRIAVHASREAMDGRKHGTVLEMLLVGRPAGQCVSRRSDDENHG